MSYPTEKQMLASIFEALMTDKQYNFARTLQNNNPIFTDQNVNELFVSFERGFNFCNDIRSNYKKLEVH